MNNKPTFREQYNKIVGAYLRNRLKPWSSCACFIGNILDNSGEWSCCRKLIEENQLISTEAIYPVLFRRGLRYIRQRSSYTVEEIIALERCFLFSQDILVSPVIHSGLTEKEKEEQLFKAEEQLFKAMEATLLLLKQIHESKGEVIEDYSFTKRELVTT